VKRAVSLVDGLAYAILRSTEVSPATRTLASEVDRRAQARWRRERYARQRRSEVRP
jgi:hypothetical protein